MFVPNRRIGGRAVMILGMCLLGAVSVSATTVDLAGFWDGMIRIQGSELGITVEFMQSDSGLTATIDIPAQNEKDLPLTNLKLDSSKITFDFPGVPGERKFVGVISENGKTMAGDFHKAGGVFTFELVKREVAPAADSTIKADKSPKLKIDTVQTAKKEKAESSKEEVITKEKPMPVEWNTNESGLKWRELAAGEGVTAEKGKTVDVHYTGWLYVDGKKGNKFDSSVDRGQPFSFPLGAGKVIKGWDEGVAGMKIGSKRELLIPPDLGYGARGYPPVIPANSTLLFEVELLKVH